MILGLTNAARESETRNGPVKCRGTQVHFCVSTVMRFKTVCSGQYLCKLCLSCRLRECSSSRENPFLKMDTQLMITTKVQPTNPVKNNASSTRSKPIISPLCIELDA